MAPNIDATTWVYVLIQNPGSNEQIVGQIDSANSISFIPMFLDRDSAGYGAVHMAKEKRTKYEIQAIIFEDLEKYAAQEGFILFVIDDEGNIIDKRAPFQSST